MYTDIKTSASKVAGVFLPTNPRLCACVWSDVCFCACWAGGWGRVGGGRVVVGEHPRCEQGGADTRLFYIFLLISFLFIYGVLSKAGCLLFCWCLA